MKSLPESENPYRAPNVDYVNDGRLAGIGFPLSTFCGWGSVLFVAGYSLLGTIANGYEMTVEFSNWRLRQEIVLALLFVFGAVLCLLMRLAHRRRSIKGITCVAVLCFPGLAYVVDDLFLNGQLFAEFVRVFEP